MCKNFTSKNIIETIYSFKILIKWIIICFLISVIIGSISALFLYALEWATNIRTSISWIIWLLPIAGFLIGLFYHYYGKDVEKGNNLIIDSINGDKKNIPLKMAPMIFVSTVVTHIFGGSAGREGTALQFSASIIDYLAKIFNVSERDRNILLISAVAGGFAGVFGTPIAGAIFALEFYLIGRINYQAIIPAFLTAFFSNEIAKLWNAPHTHYVIDSIPEFSLKYMLYAILAGIIFGICAKLFSLLSGYSAKFFKDRISYSPLRPFIGGLLIILLVFIVNSTAYLGLGIDTIVKAFENQLSPEIFLLKIIFTIVTLSSGFKGGEVTPLFFIGATLGSALSIFVDLPTGLLAGMGFVAVFSGATNTPIACSLMGMELFGAESSPYIFIACLISFLFSGNTTIYKNQKIAVNKLLFKNVKT